MPVCQMDFDFLIKVIGKIAPSLVGAFVGACLAFFFNIKLNKDRQIDENLTYLTYAITSIGALVNGLYCIKKDFVLPKMKELEKVDRDIQRAHATRQDTHISLVALTMLMHHKGYETPFDSERLYFLARQEPNLIFLIKVMSDSVKTFNAVIEDYNAYILQLSKTRLENQPPDLHLLSSYAKNLYAQTDSTLYLVELAQKRLIRSGQVIYKKKFIIKFPEVIDDYVSLAPLKIQSWEEVKWRLDKKFSWRFWAKKEKK